MAGTNRWVDRWNDRWAVFDVGETLVDETRVWATWADVVGVPRRTFRAVMREVIAHGEHHQAVFARVGAADWAHRTDQFEAAFGGFRDEDLYPDTRRCLAALAERGYRLAVVANQPARRTGELRSLGLPVEVIAMSEELGVEKPVPAFFSRVLALLGDPSPARVAYVGDRIDNDVLPAIAAGLHAVWIRRGPWATTQRLPDGTRPAAVIDSLDQLEPALPGVFATLSNRKAAG